MFSSKRQEPLDARLTGFDLVCLCHLRRVLAESMGHSHRPADALANAVDDDCQRDFKSHGCSPGQLQKKTKSKLKQQGHLRISGGLVIKKINVFIEQESDWLAQPGYATHQSLHNRLRPLSTDDPGWSGRRRDLIGHLPQIRHLSPVC